MYLTQFRTAVSSRDRFEIWARKFPHSTVFVAIKAIHVVQSQRPVDCGLGNIDVELT